MEPSDGITSAHSQYDVKLCSPKNNIKEMYIQIQNVYNSGLNI